MERCLMLSSDAATDAVAVDATEDELVEIVPHFAFSEVYMMSGHYGPFQVLCSS